MNSHPLGTVPLQNPDYLILCFGKKSNIFFKVKLNSKFFNGSNKDIALGYRGKRKGILKFHRPLFLPSFLLNIGRGLGDSQH